MIEQNNKAFVRILNRANVPFAVLGTEESCTGDPAKEQEMSSVPNASDDEY
jgi:Fe-S oxidoreductase